MGNGSNSNLFSSSGKYRRKSWFKRAAITVPKGGTYTLAKVEGQGGRFDFVHVVFEDEDDLYLKIQLDNQVLFNHSHTQIEDDGIGKLSIPLLHNFAAPMGVTRTTTSYYAFMFSGKGLDLTFEKELFVQAENRGTAAYKVQGFYVLYGILRGK